MINVEKVNEAVLNKYCAMFEIPTDGKLPSRVRALQSQQRATVAKANLSTACTACGGRSDVNLPECPFCGTADMDDASHEKAANAQKSVPPPDKAPTAIVETTGTEVVAGNIEELQAAEDQVHAAKEAGVSSYYDLGKALYVIYSTNLWKHRVGTDGRSLYRGFNEYVEKVHAMGKSAAYDMMDVANAFTREQFTIVGVKRLSLLMRFESQEKREQLLEQAKAGKLSSRQLTEMAKLEPAKAGRGNPQTAGATKAAAAKAADKASEKAATKAPKAEGELTVVSKMGRTKVELFARPTKNAHNGKQKRAVSLAQDPSGVEESLNGITIRYRLVKEKAGLTLIIERERTAAAH